MTKGYGLTVEDLSWSCPSDLQPYFDAHEIELDEKDTYVHVAVYRYGVEALSYTIDHMLNGNKAKTKLNEQSLRAELHEKEKADRPLTQEEIKQYTNEYFRQRRIDKLNFDLAQIQKQKSEG